MLHSSHLKIAMLSSTFPIPAGIGSLYHHLWLVRSGYGQPPESRSIAVYFRPLTASGVHPVCAPPLKFNRTSWPMFVHYPPVLRSYSGERRLLSWNACSVFYDSCCAKHDQKLRTICTFLPNTSMSQSRISVYKRSARAIARFPQCAIFAASQIDHDGR
jgi:hypothetical protein